MILVFSMANPVNQISTGVVAKKQNGERFVSVVRTCFSINVKYQCLN